MLLVAEALKGLRMAAVHVAVQIGMVAGLRKAAFLYGVLACVEVAALRKVICQGRSAGMVKVAQHRASIHYMPAVEVDCPEVMDESEQSLASEESQLATCPVSSCPGNRKSRVHTPGVFGSLLPACSAALRALNSASRALMSAGDSNLGFFAGPWLFVVAPDDPLPVALPCSASLA